MAIFSVQRCDDWAFDAEILYVACRMGIAVRQYPVRWSHGKNSRVKFPRDIYQTLGALIGIRWRVGRAMRQSPWARRSRSRPIAAQKVGHLGV